MYFADVFCCSSPSLEKAKRPLEYWQVYVGRQKVRGFYCRFVRVGCQKVLCGRMSESLMW